MDVFRAGRERPQNPGEAAAADRDPAIAICRESKV
jgi:hypothetical protein